MHGLDYERPPRRDPSGLRERRAASGRVSVLIGAVTVALMVLNGMLKSKMQDDYSRGLNFLAGCAAITSLAAGVPLAIRGLLAGRGHLVWGLAGLVLNAGWLLLFILGMFWFVSSRLP